MTTVLDETRDRIAYVTIDRPEARNFIDIETHEAQERCYDRTDAGRA
jgi:enoyl-CoA hydratase/carnithine racemase